MGLVTACSILYKVCSIFVHNVQYFIQMCSISYKCAVYYTNVRSNIQMRSILYKCAVFYTIVP